jgi:NAD/NADP transhydrogenase beta subunit
LPESPKTSTAWAAITTGAIIGVLAGDRFLVRRADHSRTDAGLLFLGTTAGGLIGAGVAALIDNDLHPQLVFSLATVGGLAGLVVTERSRDPRSDAGRQRVRVVFNPAGLIGLATRTQGTHSLFSVRF